MPETALRCPECRKSFKKGDKFCRNCGIHLENEFILKPVCPQCKKSYPPGSRYCEQDGERLVAAEEMVPTCCHCGKAYDDKTRFCPEDGNQVLPRYLIKNKSILKKTGKATAVKEKVKSKSKYSPMEKPNSDVRKPKSTQTYMSGSGMTPEKRIKFLVYSMYFMMIVGIIEGLIEAIKNASISGNNAGTPFSLAGLFVVYRLSKYENWARVFLLVGYFILTPVLIISLIAFIALSSELNMTWTPFELIYFIVFIIYAIFVISTLMRTDVKDLCKTKSLK